MILEIGNLMLYFPVPSLLCNTRFRMGVSNRWTGIWNGTMEWKMEWNSEHTQLQLTRVTGAAQPRLNYLVYLQG